MTRLLHIDSSVRDQGSHSRDVAAIFRHAFDDALPTARVTYRDLATAPPPHLIDAVAASMISSAERSSDQRRALTIQDELIEEFLAADAYLVSMPMYNYSVPSTIKAWIDHLMVPDRIMTPDGVASPIQDRPITVVASFGGGYGPGTPKEDWDFLRPYLNKIFVDTMGMNLTIIDVELTNSICVPNLAHLLPLHEHSRAAAVLQAAEQAEAVAKALDRSVDPTTESAAIS